ncbi:MAG: hypothetical protein AB7P40_29370 [Chloroflexota bacterium]
MPSLTADLIYDTETVRLPHGVRTVRGPERRLLFEVGDYEIIIEVVGGEAARWIRLAGQVLLDGEPVVDATITLDDGQATETDAEGRFKLVLNWMSRCGFWVQTTDLLLIVPPFEIPDTLAGVA